MREDFRVTGLAHLVAASGANVLLLATLVLAIATVAGLGLSARLWLAIAIVAAYVPLAGGGPSIQRAGVMGVAGLVAALAGRPVLALVRAAARRRADARLQPARGRGPRLAAELRRRARDARARPARWRRACVARRVPRGLAEALAVTVAATLGTAPLIALHFERLSLVSLPVNVLAAPAVAPVMWLGTIAGALGQFAPAARRARSRSWRRCRWPTSRGWPSARRRCRSRSVSSARPARSASPRSYAAAGAAALAWRRDRARRAARAGRRPRSRARRRACARRRRGRRDRRAAARARARRTPPRDLTISFLDIGQGDATLIQHGRAAVLVDTGPPDGPILERLREAGVRRLDLLVATHAALDHDGAAAAVLDEMPGRDGARRRGGAGVRRYAGAAGATARQHPPGRARSAPAPTAPIAPLAARRRVPCTPSDAGQVLTIGPLELRVLWPRRDPPAPPGAEPNDRATVIHLRDGDFDLLLTADAESNVTPGLDLPVVDALKVAHHGSDDPGLPDLLRRLRPQRGGHRASVRATSTATRRRRRWPRSTRPCRSCAAPTATARSACACATAG